MDEFMEHEEEFEARQSISSRGRDTRVQMMPDQKQQREPSRVNNNPAAARPADQQEMDYEYGEGDGESSSVITEIVDEKIVEIDSDDEENKFIEKGKENEGIINHYLDIKQEDYVNRDEYQEYDENKQDEESPDKAYAMQDDNRGTANDQQMREEMEYEHKRAEERDLQDRIEAENRAQDQLYQQMLYQNNMMENSPIAENPLEEELTTSPQYYQAPRVVNPKYRRKYEGTDLNDKSHLIWEQERIERNRIEKRMKKANIWAKPYNFRDLDWDISKNPKKAAFNFEKNPKRSSMWHFSNSSSVPMLSANNKSQKSIENKTIGASLKPSRVKYDPSEGLSKNNHNLNNLFHQSQLQTMLQGQKGQPKTPMTHTSLQKDKGRAFMTAIDNRYAFQSSVQEGRARNFHTSQIF